MCDKPQRYTPLLKQPETLSMPSPMEKPPLPAQAGPSLGSRRRRLWELAAPALCPVIGVCMPMPALRRLVGKALGGEAQASDYELHCGAIDEAKRRSAISEALQRDFDQRYALALRQSAAHKNSADLARWWAQALCGESQVAGALWATLTHARCDDALQERVLRDIHMLQHQLGTSRRDEQLRIDALIQENGVLSRELARAQERSTRLLAERAAQLEQLQAELLKLRGELMARDSLMASQREQLQRWHSEHPGLERRQAQAEQLQRLQQKLQQASRELSDALQRARREAGRADAAEAALRLAQPSPPPQAAEPANGLPTLIDRAVLCVGGRPSVVPVYRQLIERTGGRFIHHDGGEEHAATQLDASLAAADLVICQTGCISHDAYWRVKDHCKRHGKRCVFVDKPSASSLQRALGALMPQGSPQTDD